jgi:hypothetical protein
MKSTRRWAYAAWLVLIGAFALIHALNLRADFPNHSPWISDWAKYTDEGWYGNAAVRAHLFGNWYRPGDFNPAAALPVWPFLEWVLFFFTGVTIQAARGLAVAVFFLNLLLSYWLLRARGPRWMALLALTLLVTSPFLYCFSRLAILEPLLTAFTLAALNLAVRLPQFRRRTLVSVGIGLLFALMLLTKTTGLFLLPALAWAILVPLRRDRGSALRCALAALAGAVVAYGIWVGLVIRLGLWTDYRYLFRVNSYPRPQHWYWPALSLWWSIHGCMWMDRILAPLTGLLIAGAVLCATIVARKATWGRELLTDPVAGASLWAAVGCILFMTYQNHQQPRYYAVAVFFCLFLVVQGAEVLLRRQGFLRSLGWAAVAVTVVAAGLNGILTLNYAAHPQYTWVTAADRLAQYIDEHSSGNRLLLSISGDELSLIAHVQAICDDFGTEDLPEKIADYKPGWFATWNDIDPGTLQDIHTRYSLEQAASFRAFDDPERTVLVLFKLHPLPNGEVRDPETKNLNVELPGDTIYIDVD